MPKMTSAPAASRACTKLCAPVICSLIGFLFCGSCFRRTVFLDEKTPRPRWAQRGGALAGSSACALHEYDDAGTHEDTVAPHTGNVKSTRLASQHVVRRGG